MNKKSIKALSIILALLLVISSGCIWMYVTANEREVEPNVLLLENILENRYWVIESLVNDDTENNPYTLTVQGASEESFMEEVIKNYVNDDAFRILVNAFELGDRLSAEIECLSQEAKGVLLLYLGIYDENELTDYVYEHAKSYENLQYESIINAVLSTDYTTSWGTTLFESDSSLETYRQFANLFSNISNIQSAMLADSNFIQNGYFPDAKSFTSYVDGFLPAFEDSLYNVLVNIPGCESLADNRALTKKIIGTSAMAFALRAGCYDPLSVYNVQIGEYVPWSYNNFYTEYIAPKTSFYLKTIGKTLDIYNAATQCAIVLETLMNQKDTTLQTLSRIRGNTNDSNLAKTIAIYENLIDEQGNLMIDGYDIIQDYFSKNNMLGDTMTKGGKYLFKSFLNLLCGYEDLNTGVMTNAISESLTKAGKLVSIAVWVADKATNIKDTAKKVHICRYINGVIHSARDTFEKDFLAYSVNKTDENAKKCLDDLEFLKKLRLFGEKQAYGSVCSQTESVMGLLLGSSDLQKDIDRKYQANIDSIMGCTVYPSSCQEFSVDEGETLTLRIDNLGNGEKTLYGQLSKGKTFICDFPEADVVLMGALKLNGGTIKLIGNRDIDEKIQMFLPTLTVTADSTIEVINGEGAKVVFGGIENNAVLNVNFDDSTTSFDVVEELTNNGKIYFNADTSKVNFYDVVNNGTIEIPTTKANVYGNITNNGTINGEVVICGDGTKTYEDGYYEKDIQTLSGSGTYSKLIFDSRQKEGIKIKGQQSVTEYLANRSTRLRTSENIYVSGNCVIENNEFDGNISFRDYTTSTDFTVGGMAFIHNNVTFSGKATFKDGLNLTSNCQTLTLNGETVVKGDMQYSAGTIAGSDWLKLYGDLTVTASSPTISNLDFAGLTGQTVTLSSPLTVGKLNNQNLSLSGVDVTSKIYVTDQLISSSTSKYENGKNIVLTGTALLNGDKVQGSISAENWTCSNSATIKGTLFASGDIVFADNVELTASGYQQSNGTLTIPQSSKINTKGDMILSCTTTNNGEFTVEGDYKSTGAVSGGNGILNVVGDCYIQNTYSSRTLRVKGDTESNSPITLNTLVFDSKLAQKFNNTSTTNVENLEISNTSITGFTVGSVINVNNHFINNAKKLINPEKIILSNGASYDDTGFAKTDFTVSGNYTVPAGETMIVSGNLTILSGAVLTVEEGAKIEVGRSVISNGATIIVDEGAEFKIADYLNSTSDTYQVDGDLIVTGDAKLSSATVNATGLMTFKGDLTVSSGTWNNPNIAFISKVPQTISGSTINVNNITIDNTSKSGIDIQLTYNVVGEELNNNKTDDNETPPVVDCDSNTVA